jgi:predicted anti-sigma-YlaC factor YlaD
MSSRTSGLSTGRLLVLALAAALGAGCSIKKMAINGLADTLAASGDSFASDEDPDLIRDAVPFSLKTIESLLAEVPEHKGLLLTACGGFTQYAYAFVQTDAELLEPTDYQAFVAGRERALKMYQRALGYCLRRVELTHKGFRDAVEKDPAGTLKAFSKDEVSVLYWTGASWGAAISAGSEKPELINQLPVVRAIMARALELDESYERGGIHDVLISLDSLPEAMGGSVQSARRHFARSVELSNGQSASPFVSLASGISVAEQNRKEFEDLLSKALAIDVNEVPRLRLANVIYQRKARALMARADELFTPDKSPERPAAVVGLHGLGSLAHRPVGVMR